MNNSMMVAGNDDDCDDKSFESQKINFIRDQITPQRKVRPKVAKSFTRLSTNKRYNCYKPYDPSDLLRKTDLKRHRINPSPLLMETRPSFNRKTEVNNSMHKPKEFDSVKMYRAYQSPN